MALGVTPVLKHAENTVSVSINMIRKAILLSLYHVVYLEEQSISFLGDCYGLYKKHYKNILFT